MNISGWGNNNIINSEIVYPKNDEEIIKILKSLKNNSIITRGLGRSYGDMSLNKNVLSLMKYEKYYDLNEETKTLECSANISIIEILEKIVNKRLFFNVSPGSKFVTIGGAIANDVHGKNHHKDGSFAKFIDWFEIIDESGNLHRCSPTENIELFGWTIGGMGLTGIILKIAFRLRRVETAWMKQRTLVAENIDHAMSLFEGSLDAAYSVAWIDCLRRGSNMGRAIVILGDHVQLENLPEKINGYLFLKVINDL